MDPLKIGVAVGLGIVILLGGLFLVFIAGVARIVLPARIISKAAGEKWRSWGEEGRRNVRFMLAAARSRQDPNIWGA